MKIFLFSVFFVLCQVGQAQSEEKAIKELEQRHARTNFVRDSIGNHIRKYNDEIALQKDSSVIEKMDLSRDSLWNISDQNDIEELKTDIAYCKQNPSCQYSFSLVASQVARQPGKNFYDDFVTISKNASEEIKKGETWKAMSEKLVYFKQSMVGSAAPKFSGVDVSGQNISLDEFASKKYVLIDFWASWCGPCRAEIPFLDALREKYKDKGFEIVSISIDEDLDKWKSAIKKEHIEDWRHFSTVQNNSPAKMDYFVNGVPHKILIDKTGKIVGKWKASGERNKNELKTQLEQIFGF